MKYYQPVFRLSAGYVEQHTPNIYKTKEEAIHHYYRFDEEEFNWSFQMTFK